ncbi:MAG: cysB [Ramlibacter sp.]|nr:cysB [Ramlibacter sp.]
MPTLQQLMVLREIIRHDLNVTRAAESLHSSQPGLTRHLQQLEGEFGFELLVRERGRFVAISERGKVLLPVLTRVLDSADELSEIAHEIAQGATGVLTVGTGNTHARYALPAVIETFVKRNPTVTVRLRQGTHQQVLEWLTAREIDFSISTLSEQPDPELQFIPCYAMHPIVLVVPGHPLARIELPLALEDIARFPIVTYDRDFPAHSRIARVFQQQGLKINIALSATDTETVKAYVVAGLGVGIVSHTAYNPVYDTGLGSIDVRHLFSSPMAYVGVRANGSLEDHAAKLLDLFLEACGKPARTAAGLGPQRALGRLP